MNKGEVPIEITMRAYATPENGMSIDDLVVHLIAEGNEIVEIDRINNRVKIAEATEKL